MRRATSSAARVKAVLRTLESSSMVVDTLILCKMLACKYLNPRVTRHSSPRRIVSVVTRAEKGDWFWGSKVDTKVKYAHKESIQDYKARVQELEEQLKSVTEELALERHVREERSEEPLASARKTDASSKEIKGSKHSLDDGDEEGEEGEEGEDDEPASVDDMLHYFTEVLSKGYLASVERLRDRLMFSEWDQGRKQAALRAGVAQFELYCAQNDRIVSYTTFTQLYEEPTQLECIEDDQLRSIARATINVEADKERERVYHICTQEARNLASRFSQSEFIKSVLPDNAIVDAMKKLVVPAVKLLV